MFYSTDKNKKYRLSADSRGQKNESIFTGKRRKSKAEPKGAGNLTRKSSTCSDHIRLYIGGENNQLDNERKISTETRNSKIPRFSYLDKDYLTVDERKYAERRKSSVLGAIAGLRKSLSTPDIYLDCLHEDEMTEESNAKPEFRYTVVAYDDVDGPENMDENRETSFLLENNTERQYDAIDPDVDTLSVTSRDVLPPEDLMYQMRYAFINRGFETDFNVERTRETIPEAEQVQFRENILEILPECPIPLKQKLNICRSLRTGGGSRRDKQHDSMKYATTKKSREYSKLIFMLWEGTISKLSAYFGSNVASYFYFLRFLLYLNFVVGILVVCFVTVPQIISGDILGETKHGHFGDLSTSVMFYGAYSNSYIDIYDEPLAYLITWAAVSLFCFIVIAISMQVRYRRSKLTGNDKDYEFAWRLFCSWDHSIFTKEGAKDRYKSICTEMQEKIREEKKRAKRTLCFKFGLLIVRLITNVFVLGLLGGSGYLIFYIANVEYDFPEAYDDIENFFKKYQLSAMVAVLKLIVPLIFRLLMYVEGLKPRTEQKLLMTRTTMFYFASLAVFIVSLYDVAIGCVDNSQNAPNTTDDDNVNLTQNRSYCCWENQVGEEVFKVVLIDFGLFVAIGIFFHIVRAVLVACRMCPKMVKRSQFDVPSSVLDLIYAQGLVWLGLYFSPLLVAAGFIKLVIVFYFRYFVARAAMIPPKQLFRASRSGNFYLFLLLLTWFLCLLPIAYAIAQLPSSWDCGPFSDQNYAYELITNYIGNSPEWLEEVLYYVGTPAVELPIIMLLILLVLFYKSRSSAYEALVKELRNQLTIERRVERRKVFARAISAPIASVGKVSGSTISLAPGSIGRASASSLSLGSFGRAVSTPNMTRAITNKTFSNDVLDEETYPDNVP